MNLDNNTFMVNNKNKLLYIGEEDGQEVYYLITCTQSEYNNQQKPYLSYTDNTGANTAFNAYGIEPTINVIKGGAVVNKYNFRTDGRDSNTIRVSVPYPIDLGASISDRINSNTGSVCIEYGESVYQSNITVKRKPNIADIQILYTTEDLHIFILCDIISVTHINDHTRNANIDYSRTLIYQKHPLNISNFSYINTVPSSVTAFPIKNNDYFKYGKFVPTEFTEKSTGDWMGKNNVYRGYLDVTDFHVGLINLNTIYCIFATTDGNIHFYSNYKDWTDESTWAYVGNSIKYPPISSPSNDCAPFNIYSHYLGPHEFYFSYSYYERNASNSEKFDMKYVKSKIAGFFYTRAGFYIVSKRSSYGMIVYDKLTDFIWRLGSISVYHRNNHIGSTGLGTIKDGNIQDLHKKYKMVNQKAINIYPKLGVVSEDRIGDSFGARSIIDLYNTVLTDFKFNAYSLGILKTHISDNGYNIYSGSVTFDGSALQYTKFLLDDTYRPEYDLKKSPTYVSMDKRIAFTNHTPEGQGIIDGNRFIIWD